MTERHPFWERVGPEIAWVHRQLRRLGVHEVDLEDVCQDVLVTVFRTWMQYDHDRPIRPWLFGFAFRIASDYRKRASYKKPPLPLDVEPAGPGGGPEQDARAAQARRIAVVALQEVPEPRRSVLVLADFEDLAAPEIAEALDIPVNTVYSRLRVARTEFTAAVQSLLGRDGPSGGGTSEPQSGAS